VSAAPHRTSMLLKPMEDAPRTTTVWQEANVSITVRNGLMVTTATAIGAERPDGYYGYSYRQPYRPYKYSQP
jgi:hypothetical protein